MKRYIVINGQRTAIVVSDNLSSSIGLVVEDTDAGDKVIAIDTERNVAYVYRVLPHSCFTIVEEGVPVQSLLAFAGLEIDAIYRSLFESFL